jgi:hypothetical protein
LEFAILAPADPLEPFLSGEQKGSATAHEASRELTLAKANATQGLQRIVRQRRTGERVTMSAVQETKTMEALTAA